MEPMVQGLQQQIQQQAAVQQQQIAIQQEMVQRMTALGEEVTSSTARADAAEQERKDVLRLAAAAHENRGGDSLVDGRGVGQPFKFNGKADQDWSEWSLKLLVYLKAKFGVEIERTMKWASKQKKPLP